MEKNIRIVCLGDSTTYGFPYGPQDSWVTMLKSALNAEVINKGINGNTTYDMLIRFERAVIQYHPDYVIITGGINDIVQGESFDSIINNLSLMTEKASKANIKVVMGLPTAVDYPPFEKILVRLREWITDFSAQRNWDIIDFSQPFYDENGNIKSSLLLPDGGHPTREGYKEMFAQIDLNLFK